LLQFRQVLVVELLVFPDEQTHVLLVLVNVTAHVLQLLGKILQFKQSLRIHPLYILILG